LSGISENLDKERNDLVTETKPQLPSSEYVKTRTLAFKINTAEGMQFFLGADNVIATAGSEVEHVINHF
jgi:GTP cyclohydrolase III